MTLFSLEGFDKLRFKNYFPSFSRIGLKGFIAMTRKRWKKEGREGVQGYPPQSFLPVPQLDIAYPVPRPISPTNFDNRVPKLSATLFIPLVPFP